MNNYLTLKMTFRNRRFLFFTMITPLLFYLLMHLINRNDASAGSNSLLMVTCSVVMGIAGNSLVTFAKSFNYTKNFYLLQMETSPYTIKQWIFDDLLCQTILNAVIAIVVIIFGMLLGDYGLSGKLLILFLLLLYLGIYLSLFGFLIGQWLDAQTLDATSFFLMFAVMFLLIPFHEFANGKFEQIITKIQQLFPPYYLYQVITAKFLGQTWMINVGWFIGISLLTGIPVIIGIYYLLKKQTV
ncbi:multidrug ABC transporter permease [Fructilactobacillus carniphilus]|uniref:Multidrug ABC transporter permease n=1 Tax=Fructilactobacillus carniphilus TaxID=2940297 RepID=A0ABY5BX53_9LACO|nr:multidrug ABC transporter permease [Fructilactobacillus carniphilus]USS91086.1 multidrug ABC transporter permease [Fructilactobacillus carniphilus]